MAYVKRLLCCIFLIPLISCLSSGGSASSSGEGDNSVVALDQKGVIRITRDSSRDVTVRFKPQVTKKETLLRFATSEPEKSYVSPTHCFLKEDDTCELKVMGADLGPSTLLVTADGTTSVLANMLVGTSKEAGVLTVQDDSGKFSSQPKNMTYAVAGKAPYSVTVTGKLSDSSGILASDNAYINFSYTGEDKGKISGLPNQCQVTTAAPQCSVTFTVDSEITLELAASVAGSVVAEFPPGTYKPIPLTITPHKPSPTDKNGKIVLSTQQGNVIPEGMRGPLFVNWLKPLLPGAYKVDLSITASDNSTAPIAFYWYEPGDNATVETASTPPDKQACILRYQSASGPDILSCGYGLVGLASGKVTVSAVVTQIEGTNLAELPSNLALSTVNASATARRVVFVNDSSKKIWLGITGGAANSYISPSDSTIPAGTPSANIKPGAGSTCGPSNPAAACPIGATCRQGGASPNSDIEKTPFYCYYDQGIPVGTAQQDPYLIVPSGGKTVLTIPSQSLSPGGIYWSGNYYARTNCDSASGCDISCNKHQTGDGCDPGTGGNPGIATLAELTFQQQPQTDFYDVSVINGANFAVEFGPVSAVGQKNSYDCGVAGSRAGNNGWAGASLSNLPASSWKMGPSIQSFPLAKPGVLDDPASYFKYVSTSGSRKVCSSANPCSAPNEVCGYDNDAINKGDKSDYTRRCGPLISWVTANSIWGFNQDTSSNRAPFQFAVSDSHPDGTWVVTGNKVPTTVGNYQLCNNATYSSYQEKGANQSILACGGVMWGDTQNPGPIDNPIGNIGLNITLDDGVVHTASKNWLTYVLPTITWLKIACPTCYTYPFDDKSSTFTCREKGGNLEYLVRFTDITSGS